MATSFKKKIFLLVFCLASITQGMYSTYFVSILTTIERIYQIQSKTAGAILSATEIGQILGSLFIAYYGGRGNKPKWISVCMTLSAFAALISISPHFILLATNNDTNINQQQAAAAILEASSRPPSSSSSSLPSPYLTSDLSGSSSSRSSSSGGSGSINDGSETAGLDHQRVRNITTQLAAAALGVGGRAHAKAESHPSFDQLCRIGNYTGSAGLAWLDTTNQRGNIDKSISNTAAAAAADISARAYGSPAADFPVALVISIFSICLLAIGFGSTAITTLGIPFIDDIISREESPFYLGLTIGLRIFGPALGFLLGSFCIRLNANSLLGGDGAAAAGRPNFTDDGTEMIGAWWLGLIVISLPLLVLAIPMYFLSRYITGTDGDEKDDYEDITYQAAEDHDIGGSHDFPAHHVLGLTGGGGGGDLDVMSSRTCFSSGGIDSSSREVLQMCAGGGGLCNANYGQNIAFVEQPILATSDCMKTCLGPDDTGCLSSSQAHTSVRRLVVNQLNEFEGAQVGDGTSRQRQQQQLACSLSPQPPVQPRRSSTRSSVASTMSGSSTTFVGADDDDATTKNNKLKRKALRQQQQHKGDCKHNGQSTIGDLSSSLWRLLRNKLLVLRMLSGVLHILPIAGFYTFLPKYLIEQFRISSSSASAISGLAGILFVGFGAFIGGTIIRLFNVNSRIMTRWIATSALVYAIGMIVLMNLDCQQNQIVHFNSLEFVSTDCSSSCQCLRATYNPVCANGTTFMSPCLAGCKGHTIMPGGRVIFGECGCAPKLPKRANESTSAPRWPPAIASTNNGSLNIATQGQCLNNCDNIVWYVILFSIFTLIHASCEVGSMMFNLRCVKSDDRTLALGLITFSSSLLGTIPCSIIYGSVVDFTCVHWDTYISRSGGSSSSSLAEENDAAARGACRAYDNDSFRYYLHGLTALVMLIAFIVDCIISSRANEVDFYEGTDESKMDIRIGLKKSTETIQ